MKKFLFVFLFFITSFSANAQNYITAVEYWFDTLYSARTGQSLVPQSEMQLSTTVSTTGLAKGLHVFNIRFQQTSGYWSSTASSYFFKAGESVSDTGFINAYRYWVQGKDSVITVDVVPPVSPLDLAVTLDLSWVKKGNNYLYIQFRDELYNWSVAAVDTFFKLSTPVADFYTDDTSVCINDTVRFINTSIDADLYMWNFGDGDSSSLEEPFHIYSQPGNYTVMLTINDTVGGQDSTLILTDYIRVAPAALPSFSFSQSHLTITITNTSQFAHSYLWDFGDGDTSTLFEPVHTYLHDGNYTITLYAYDSCGMQSDTQIVSFFLTYNFIEEKNVVIYYSDHHVNMIFRGNEQKLFYRLITPAGQTVINGDLPLVSPGYIERFSTAHLADGIYFLQLMDEKGRMLCKAIVSGL
jgi:PKD repeat protein